MASDERAARFEIEKVDFGTQSEGPDYFTTGAYRVTDRTTGQVVAEFPWTLDEAYLTNASYSGPDAVTLSVDGTEAIATGGAEGEQRILLPVESFAVSFDGILLTDRTDYGALAERIAEDDGPAGEHGWRQPGGQWLWKLHDRLGRTAAAASLERRVASFLDDPNPRRRAAALLFYYFLPEAPGADRVWELAETRRQLFSAEFPGCSSGRTLNDELIKSLSMAYRRCERDERRIRVARAESLNIE